MSVAKTDLGAREVEDLIGRLSTGSSLDNTAWSLQNQVCRATFDGEEHVEPAAAEQQGREWYTPPSTTHGDT